MTGCEQLLHDAHDLLAHRDVAGRWRHLIKPRRLEPMRMHAPGGRWTAHMLTGNFAAAWRESDTIRAGGAPDPHRFWAGENLRGRRVMLRCLHGYGDAVQFLRYAPRLQRTASRLTVEVPPAMMEIARYFCGVDDVITWGVDAPARAPSWDVQVEVMELPYLFRTGSLRTAHCAAVPVPAGKHNAADCACYG